MKDKAELIDPRINYHSSGNGFPFVFQHGLAANLSQSQALLKELSNIELISTDSPGHGGSPLPAGRIPSFQFYADQVLNLLESLNIKKAIFGGISMGAGIALNIALRFPEKVEALVLVRPAWLDKTSPQNLGILIEAVPFMRRENDVKSFMKNTGFLNIQEALPEAAQSVLGVFSPSQRREIPLVIESMINDCPFHDIEALKQIEKPCLVIGNSDDPLHPFEMAEITHQYIRGSELHKVISRYIDDSEHQKSVKEIVSKFIKANEELLERK